MKTNVVTVANVQIVTMADVIVLKIKRNVVAVAIVAKIFQEKNLVSNYYTIATKPILFQYRFSCYYTINNYGKSFFSRS
jgi:hypothetical protein